MLIHTTPHYQMREASHSVVEYSPVIAVVSCEAHQHGALIVIIKRLMPQINQSCAYAMPIRE